MATVIDCHTKAVIGWATDDNYKTPLIEKAIEMDPMPRALGRSDARREPFVVTAGDICWSAGCFRVSGEAGEAPC